MTLDIDLRPIAEAAREFGTWLAITATVLGLFHLLATIIKWR